MKQLLTYLLLITVVLSDFAWAELNLKHRSEFRPSDYLLRENRRRDSSFDNMKVVDLGFNVGLGSDCGKIKLDASLKAALRNIFDIKYFAEMGRDVLDGSWMLVICYLSPNWCSILRHFRLNAQFVGRMRQNQCDAINKYVDNRVSEFNRSRQECVSKVLESGGNAEEMAEKCGNRNLYTFNLKSWVNESRSAPSENRLLQDSAEWAGFKNNEVINLAKKLVGETIVAKGSVRVEYGPHAAYLPPRRLLIRMAKGKKKELCEETLQKIDSNNGRIGQAVTQADIDKLNGNSGVEYLDRQTIRYLSLLPYKKRKYYCNKIAWALANVQFSHETSQVLNFLSVASQNINLPPQRKQELIQKKRQLKEDLEHVRIEQVQTNTPLNKVAAEVTREGRRYQDRFIEREGQVSRASITTEKTQSNFYNCITPAMCEEAR